MLDAKVRREIAQLGRLWLLALACAGTGATVVSRTGSVKVGIIAFLISLVILGPVLWVIERRLRRRRPQPDATRP
ncbi:hypothetical protein GCM10022197_22150 [Microlunatus spumicola]|uniref:Uncharacterized protein n=1 Tax=Microlunatus spumicola TaxID=81499 RepID=A0ABP6XIK7_9ACTN